MPRRRQKLLAKLNKKKVLTVSRSVTFQYAVRKVPDMGAKAFRALQNYMIRNNKTPYNFNRRAIENQTQQKVGMGGLFALLGCICLPFIAPVFAAPGLFGAAAYTSGLAALGGGSLAAGGLGMAGGTALVAATSFAIGSTLPASEQSFPYDYNDIIKDEKGVIIFSGVFTRNIPMKGKLYFEGITFDIK